MLLIFYNYILLPKVHFSFCHIPQYIGGMTSSPLGSVFVGVKFQAPTSCKGTEASLPQKVSLFQGLNHGEMVWGQKGPLEGVYLRGSLTRPHPLKDPCHCWPQPSLEPPRTNPSASHRPWAPHHFPTDSLSLTWFRINFCCLHPWTQIRDEGKQKTPR